MSLILYFMIYSFIGWLCESVFCSTSKKKFINSGFMSGPFCPIYGCGALLAIILLQPFYGSPVLVFILGILITSTLEYFTSWLMEKCFHVMWWDYSNHRFHLHGRVCLINSILFGIMSLAAIYIVHPFVEGLVLSLSEKTLSILVILFVIYFVIDFSASFIQLVNFSQDIKQFEKAVIEVKQKLKEQFKIKDLSVLFDESNQHYNEWKEQLKNNFYMNNERYHRRHLKHAFPDWHLSRKKEDLLKVTDYFKDKVNK